MTDHNIETALRELKEAVDRLRTDLRGKDEELARLRQALADRDDRIRALGEQTLHLLDLLQEARHAPGGAKS